MMDMERKDPFGNVLPPRLFYKFGAYHYVLKLKGRPKWERLSADYPTALKKWAERTGAVQGATTVAQAVEAYLVERGPVLAPKTLKSYRSSQDRINAWAGAVFLDELARQEVRAWLHARKKAAVSANRDLALLRAALNFAVECGWIADNPAQGVRRHAETPRRRIATPEERKALSDAATPLWRALLAMELLTGMDESHIRLLKRSQLTEEGISFTRSKTGVEILIEWSSALREARDAAYAAVTFPSIYVFPARHGGPYTENGFRTMWGRLKDAARVEGLEFRDLRRTAATDSESLEAARDLLGHSSTAITGRVYKVKRRARPVE